MKTLPTLFLIVIASATHAQLKLNSDNGFYEHSIAITDREELAQRITEANLEPSEDLKVKGSFSHMLNGYAPVEFSYIGKERNDKYVLTNFKMKGGISNAWVNLEELPQKHRNKWIKIINEKIEGLGI